MIRFVVYLCRSQYIEGLKKTGVRIIILTSYEIAARAVICEAFRQVRGVRQSVVEGGVDVLSPTGQLALTPSHKSTSLTKRWICGRLIHLTNLLMTVSMYPLY